MAGASKSVQQYLRSVNQANAALSHRWSAISNHLRFGLAQPVGTSAFLFKAYAPPNEFIADPGSFGNADIMPPPNGTYVRLTFDASAANRDQAVLQHQEQDFERTHRREKEAEREPGATAVV